MSKDVCIRCSGVVATTADQNLVKVIKKHTLEEIDADVGDKSFSDLLYKEFKDGSKTVCICDQCYDEL